MRRREFITLLGGATLGVPHTGLSQPMPVVGMLLSGSRASFPALFLDAFYSGLGELGYVEGRNVAIEYRWAEDRHERFRELAEELSRRRMTVIVAVGSPAVAAAKAATSSIPIVFYVGVDPVLFSRWSRIAVPMSAPGHGIRQPLS
jgi:putative tryptophan/tyrosine transport system substrate-binding protein